MLLDFLLFKVLYLLLLENWSDLLVYKTLYYKTTVMCELIGNIPVFKVVYPWNLQIIISIMDPSKVGFCMSIGHM